MRQHLRLFVATGTGLPFPRLLKAIEPLAREAEVELFGQRGAAGPSFAHLPGEDFISREDFEARLGWADVVVCHGGAGTLYEAHLAGHLPIVVPRLSRFGEHVNDHQLELAHALATSHRATLCQDLTSLRALVLSAKPRSEPLQVDPPLVQAIRTELLAPSQPIPKPSLIATALSLFRRYFQ